jgi:hypothetical protein
VYMEPLYLFSYADHLRMNLKKVNTEVENAAKPLYSGLGVEHNLIQQSVVNSLLRYWWGLLTGVLTGRIRLVPGKGPNRIRISIVP